MHFMKMNEYFVVFRQIGRLHDFPIDNLHKIDEVEFETSKETCLFEFRWYTTY